MEGDGEQVRAIDIEQLRARVRRARGPQFVLPARFEPASFDNFVPDPAYPAQAEAVALIGAAVQAAGGPASRWPWRRREPDGPRAIYLDGPPGIGKTHLLAAAFNATPEPRLFVTFDELLAAAGTLGMPALGALLARQRLVCVDEIDLGDPANIMLLTSLVRVMLAGRPRVLATANADPLTMDGDRSLAEVFARELGEIAGAFTILSVDGRDWREAGAACALAESRPGRPSDPRVARLRWEDLLAFLHETHPMYDAAWLTEVDLIALDRLAPLADTNQAIRFVRFVDRVYDRAVGLAVEAEIPPPEEVLAPLRGDRRFGLRYARCRSRLLELVYARIP